MAPGDSLWAVDIGGLEFEIDEGFSIQQTTDGGFIMGGNKDCAISHGGGCETPHAWLLKLGPEGPSHAVEPDTGRLTLSAFPNPFSMRTTVSFDLPEPGSRSLTVFDVKGRSIRVLIDGFMESGRREIAWNGRDHFGRPAKPGVYFIRLSGWDGVPARVVLSR